MFNTTTTGGGGERAIVTKPEPGHELATTRAGGKKLALEFRRQDERDRDLLDLRDLRRSTEEKWIEYLLNFASWKTFLSLTIDSKKNPGMTTEGIINCWFNLNRVLNQNFLGHRWQQRVGHAYYDYVRVIEKQKRGELHLHLMTSERVDFDIIHAYWGKHIGYAWCEPVKDQRASVEYLCKYITKNPLDLYIFKCKKPGTRPAVLPEWFSGIKLTHNEIISQLSNQLDKDNNL